jgi:hypothetical protein
MMKIVLLLICMQYFGSINKMNLEVDEDIIQIIFFHFPFLGLQENCSDLKKYIPRKRGNM